RRRHTRFSRNWSSDVCSSDLGMHQSSGKAQDGPGRIAYLGEEHGAAGGCVSAGYADSVEGSAKATGGAPSVAAVTLRKPVTPMVANPRAPAARKNPRHASAPTASLPCFIDPSMTARPGDTTPRKGTG